MIFHWKENVKNRILWFSAIGFFSIIILYRALIVISYKQELVNGESNNIWNAVNVAHGKPLYSNPEELPLEVFQYTPLSQLPIVLYALIFDSESPEYIYNISFCGRLTALFLNLIAAYFIFLILRNIFDSETFTSFLGALLFFSTLVHTSFAIRPDPLLITSNLILAYGFILGLINERHKLLYLMSFLVGLTMLIKQDAFFIMGPVGVYLLLHKKWRQLIISSFLFFIGIIFFFGIAHLVLGEYFIYSVTKGLQMKSIFSQGIAVFDRAISLYGIQFVISLTIATYFSLFFFKQKKELLISLFVLIYAALGFLSSFKPGSWVNYYTFFILFGSVLLIVFFLNQLKNYKYKELLLILTITIGGIFTFRQVYFYTSPFLKLTEHKKEYHEAYTTSVNIKNTLSLNDNDNIIVGNQLIRNFLFKNSVMVNTEFYGLSPFNYDIYRNKKDKNITYVIAQEHEIVLVKNLMNYFNIDFNNYNLINQVNNYKIFRKNG